VGPERGPLSLVSTTEELLKEKVAAPVYKTEIAAVGIRLTDHVGAPIRKTIGTKPPTSGGRSFYVARSPTQATEFVCFFDSIDLLGLLIITSLKNYSSNGGGVHLESFRLDTHAETKRFLCYVTR
jgi:hypothetical protein